MIQSPVFQFDQSTSYQTLFSELLIPNNSAMNAKGVIKRSKSDNKQLKNQLSILRKLQNNQGFPRLISQQYDKQGQLASLNIQKLGVSLKTLISNSTSSKTQIPIQTIVSLALQMLDRVEALHQCGYIHQDLKPQHFLFQKQDMKSCLYLIDFGLSRQIEDQIQPQYEGSQTKTVFKGNICYASVNSMKGKKVSIIDDLESILYIIAEMLEGQLPWKPISINSPQNKCWRSLFTKVLLKKLKRQQWNKYGNWIYSTLNKIRSNQDPYYEFRSNICKLLQLQL